MREEASSAAHSSSCVRMPESVVVAAVSTSTATQCSSAPLRSTFSCPAASSPAARSRICLTSITGLRRIDLHRAHERARGERAPVRGGAPLGGAGEERGAVDGAGRGADDEVEARRQPEPLERRRHPGGDDAAHAAALEHERHPVPVRARARPRAARGAARAAPRRRDAFRQASAGDRSEGASATASRSCRSGGPRPEPRRIRGMLGRCRAERRTNLVVPVPLDVLRAMARTTSSRDGGAASALDVLRESAGDPAGRRRSARPAPPARVRRATRSPGG